MTSSVCLGTNSMSHAKLTVPGNLQFVVCPSFHPSADFASSFLSLTLCVLNPIQIK